MDPPRASRNAVAARVPGDQDERMVPLTGVYADLLPKLQAVATRLWRPTTWQHAGQLAWNSAFVDVPTPAAAWADAAFGWLESPGCLELAVDPPSPGSSTMSSTGRSPT